MFSIVVERQTQDNGLAVLLITTEVPVDQNVLQSTVAAHALTNANISDPVNRMTYDKGFWMAHRDRSPRHADWRV